MSSLVLALAFALVVIVVVVVGLDCFLEEAMDWEMGEDLLWISWASSMVLIELVVLVVVVVA